VGKEEQQEQEQEVYFGAAAAGSPRRLPSGSSTAFGAGAALASAFGC